MTFLLNPWRFASAGGGGATIQYVGGTTAAFNGFGTGVHTVSLTSLTGGLAAAPAAGDIVIVSYGSNSSIDTDISVATAGYVETADIYGNDSLDINFGTFYKIMGGTPDASVDLNPNGDSGSGSSCAVVIQVWRGVNAATPMDVAASTATGGNTGQPNPPAITPVSAGAIVIVCASAPSLNGGSALSQVGSELSHFVSVYSDHGDTSNNDCTTAMGSFAWTSGSFDPVQLVGNASTSLSWAAVTMVLRPA